MMMPIPPPGPDSPWRAKLRRIRFGAEPISSQLDQARRATWALTGVSTGIALMFLAIFGAFGRVDVGAVVVAVLFVPVVGLAWLDDQVLRSRVAAYLVEIEDAETRGNG